MKVFGLDGREYHMRLVSRPRENASGLHLEARALLEELFPMEQRLEEVPLPGSGGLFADFLVTGKRLIVEVQGRQHSEYVGHFHRDRSGFARSLKRDGDKADWCWMNRFRLACLHDGWQERWRGILVGEDREGPR